MTPTAHPKRRWSTTAALGVLLALAVALTGLTACGKTPSIPDGELVGLFRLTPGAVQDGKLTGTYFRMIQPGGTADNGPYMVNANSPADGGQATILEPGSAGGLRTGGYQTQPVPAFAPDGDSLAGSITKPTKFFAVAFSISTNPIDLQTKTAVPPPTVTLHDGKLTADVSSWAASWNRQDFNQGAPKPVSSTQAKAPGQQQAERVWDWAANRWLQAPQKATVTGPGATGTFDPDTKAFTLDWTSLIQGGPFNSFIGKWHLTGTFEPSQKAPESAGAS
ncbi:hypothetical protein QSJ19_19090 [Gordonia sp. ABSL11-1]|uniref:hypothetical protein n=1 Tax=Gordonia sp. ABSL11-1 TaxID=3053924 RepID=UPI0025735E69|nr:hypothetical protein [Gordonia sp. ABSL11-1]MDL9947648.1 hypothetical protein [Gordonia sp. ABSL11-1]